MADHKNNAGLKHQQKTVSYDRQQLSDKCSKVELQKICRELGLSGIWTTKDKLIDMIVEKSELKEKEKDSDISCQPSNTISTKEILTQLGNIQRKLETKDLEIELLNTEIKTAYSTISRLNERILALEEKIKIVTRDQTGPDPEPVERRHATQDSPAPTTTSRDNVHASVQHLKERVTTLEKQQEEMKQKMNDMKRTPQHLHETCDTAAEGPANNRNPPRTCREFLRGNNNQDGTQDPTNIELSGL